jgi:hypothetical protein
MRLGKICFGYDGGDSKLEAAIPLRCIVDTFGIDRRMVRFEKISWGLLWHQIARP